MKIIKEQKINEKTMHLLYEEPIIFENPQFNYFFYKVVREIKKKFLWKSYWEIDPNQQAGVFVEKLEDIGAHYMTQPKKDPGGWVRSSRLEYPVRRLGVQISRVIKSPDEIDISFIPKPINDFYPY